MVTSAFQNRTESQLKQSKQVDNLLGSATVLLVIISAVCGACLSAIGTGIGLLFLDFTKGIGIGILCFGVGTVCGMTIFAKRIIRATGKVLIETIKSSQP